VGVGGWGLGLGVGGWGWGPVPLGGGMNWYFVGVDLGRRRDFTALRGEERGEWRGGGEAAGFGYRKERARRRRYGERVPLGSPYAEVAERVVALTRSKHLAGRCRLAVDATGVGGAVVDLLRRTDPGCTMMPATITSGERESYSGGYYRIPKREL